MGDNWNGIPEVCSVLVTSVSGYSKKPFDEKSGWRDSSWFEQPIDLILKTPLPYFIKCFFFSIFFFNCGKLYLIKWFLEECSQEECLWFRYRIRSQENKHDSWRLTSQKLSSFVIFKKQPKFPLYSCFYDTSSKKNSFQGVPMLV